MDLRKLEIFVAVADSGGFSAAARALHMAQPAVSIAVRKLEEDLGVALVHRNRSQSLVTAEGEQLLKRARNLLTDAKRLREEAQGLTQLREGQVQIACPSMVASYHLPGLLGEFMAAFPQLTVAVTQQGTQDIQGQLEAGELELGVTVGRQTQDKLLEHLPLYSDRLCLVMRPDNPLANRRYLRFTDLRGLSLLIYESGYHIRDAFMQGCAAHGVEPELRMQTNFLPLLLEMTRQGAGVTLGLQLMAERETDLVFVPLSPLIEVPLRLGKLSGRRLSLPNAAFYQWMEARAGS